MHLYRKVRVTCDRCADMSFDAETLDDSVKLDVGWAQVELHDCGSTGYSRTDVFCPACIVKYMTSGGDGKPKFGGSLWLSRDL